MGTPALSSLASSFSPKASNIPGGGASPAIPPRQIAPQRAATASFHAKPEQAPKDTYERAVYRSLETRQALSLQYTSLQAQLGQGGEGGSTATSINASQLNFSFFEETRLEELAYFKNKTHATGDRLEGPRQASFFAASQEIATRFEVSVSISGAALNGFANTAEGAAGSDALIDRLLEISNTLLGKADELVDRFFSQLDGSNGEFNAQSIGELFNEFAAGILELFSGNTAPALGLNGQNTGNGASGGALQSSAVQLEFKFEFSASITQTQAVVEQGDPIVFDLDNDGIELSHYKNGARFDLIGTGKTQQTAFVNGGDAFLALDRNGDGIINSGKELFGEQHGARNGFEELRKFDLNNDGVIDRRDAVFNDLKLFRDNGNGITESGELISLADAGIEAIELGYKETDIRAAGANRITQIANYFRTDGSKGSVADALLNYIA